MKKIDFDRVYLWFYDEKSIFVLQISSSIVKFPKQAPPTLILSSHNIPSKVDWDLGVNRALQMIERNDSSLTKVDYISIASFPFVQIFSVLLFFAVFVCSLCCKNPF